MLSFTCQQFLVKCKDFRRLSQQIPPNKFKDEFLSSLVSQKESQETQIIQQQLKIVDGPKLQALHINSEEKIVIKYENYVAQDSYWKCLARQTKFWSLRKALRRQEETIKQFKEIQDAINTYQIVVKFSPFLRIQGQQGIYDRDKYQNFLIIYLIFGLRAIITVKRYEKFLRQGTPQLQKWKNQYMSRKVQRYYEESKEIYEELKNKRDDFIFIFQLIIRDIINDDYIESLCVLYNTLHSLNDDRSIGIAPFYKEAFLSLLDDNKKPFDEEIKAAFKFKKVNQWNQMELYRMIEVDSQGDCSKFKNAITQLFGNLIEIKSSSSKEFMFHINPLHKGDFLGVQKPIKQQEDFAQIEPTFQKKKKGPANEVLDKPFFQEAAKKLKQKWAKDHQKFFYCQDHNIVCMIACRSQEHLLHISKKFLQLNVLWMRAFKAVFNVEYQNTNKKWNILKIYYIDLDHQDVGSTYGNSKQQELNCQTNMEIKESELKLKGIFKKILKQVRVAKRNRPLKEYTNSFQIIKKTGTVASNINQLRGLQKAIVIQNYCNIFFRILEQPQIKCLNPIPLMFCILLQALRISYSYLKRRKIKTENLSKEISDIYNRVRRFVGFGLEEIKFQQISSPYKDDDQKDLLSKTKDMFEKSLIQVQSFYQVGIFWSYIKFASNISTKTIKSLNEINNTVKTILSRMLTECVLFYYTDGQIKNATFAYYKKMTIDLQVYFMALTYGLSIKSKLQSYSQISKQTRDSLTRPVAILARELKNRIKDISQHPIKKAKLVNTKAEAQKLEEQLNNMYGYNIPYTSENIQEWKKDNQLSIYQDYACRSFQGECRICSDLSHIFKDQDCFSRFEYLLDLIPVYIQANSYTQQYEQIMNKLYGPKFAAQFI